MTTIQLEEQNPGSKLRYIIAAVSIIFGIVTIMAGGSVLFFSEQARNAAGNYVPFVLWANFTGGFLYVTVGFLALVNSSQVLRLSLLVVLLSATVLIALGVHIAGGGAYETRTLAAMSFRTIIWTGIAYAAYKMNRRSV